MSPDRSQRHLTHEVILDLLEDRLDAARRRDAERHLGRPCARCRERLRAMGALVGRLRAGDLEPVPEALTRSAIDLFPGRSAAAEPAAARVLRWALTFDSQARPLAGAALRSVGEARRLRFEHAAAQLELEAEPESIDQCVVRGRLETPAPELYRVIARVGGEEVERWADAGGHFVFEGLPRGSMRVTVIGPDHRFETPPFET